MSCSSRSATHETETKEAYTTVSNLVICIAENRCENLMKNSLRFIFIQFIYFLHKSNMLVNFVMLKFISKQIYVIFFAVSPIKLINSKKYPALLTKIDFKFIQRVHF